MSLSNVGLFRNFAKVQSNHDAAFDKAFAIRREAERLLREKRSKQQPRITVSSEKRVLPF